MTALLPVRWKESLERVSDNIGHFLERLSPYKKSNNGPETITAEVLPAFMQFGGPLLDMHESGHELVVTVEVPGLKREDISVELSGKLLSIRGEKRISRERKGGDGIQISERECGRFTRSVQLPYTVDEGSIHADLKNGVLVIRLPKPEAERSGCMKVPVS